MYAYQCYALGLMPKESDKYKLTLDGEIFENISLTYNEYIQGYCAGNLALAGLGEPTEENYFLAMMNGMIIICASTAGEHTVSLEMVAPIMETVHKLDKKYLDVDIDVPYEVDEDGNATFERDVIAYDYGVNVSLINLKNTVQSHDFKIQSLPTEFVGVVGEGRNSAKFNDASTHRTKGENSVAFGSGNVVLGEDASARGSDNVVLNIHGDACGYRNIASGLHAYAEGYGYTQSKRYTATKYGSYNNQLEVKQNIWIYPLVGLPVGIGGSIMGGIYSDWFTIKSVEYTSSSTIITLDRSYETSSTNFNINIYYSGVSAGDAAHSEGSQTLAQGDNSHSQGSNTKAIGAYSDASGLNTIAIGEASSSRGSGTLALGNYSNVEGPGACDRIFTADITGLSQLKVDSSGITYEYLLEKVGFPTRVSAYTTEYSRGDSLIFTITSVEEDGDGNIFINLDKELFTSKAANGFVSYVCVEIFNSGVAKGAASHSEGSSLALANYTHSEGYKTIADSDYQHVQGKFNIRDSENKYAHIVGNGNVDTEGNIIRSNAHTVDWYGNAWYAGSIEAFDGLILKSSTEGSTKRFKITVDDSGIISATELTE